VSDELGLGEGELGLELASVGDALGDGVVLVSDDDGDGVDEDVSVGAALVVSVGETVGDDESLGTAAVASLAIVDPAWVANSDSVRAAGAVAQSRDAPPGLARPADVCVVADVKTAEPAGTEAQTELAAELNAWKAKMLNTPAPKIKIPLSAPNAAGFRSSPLTSNLASVSRPGTPEAAPSVRSRHSTHS
jgi:hypothetical protein